MRGRRITTILAVLACSTMLTGCSIDFSTIQKLDPRLRKDSVTDTTSTIHEIAMGKNLLNISGMDVLKLMNNIKQMDMSLYESMDVSDNALVLTLTDEQIQTWKDYYVGKVDEIKTNFNAESLTYKMVLADDYSSMDILCDSDCAQNKLPNYMQDLRTDIAMIQLLNGKLDGDIACEIRLTNSATGEVAQTLKITDTYTYDESLWTVGEEPASNEDPESTAAGETAAVSPTPESTPTPTPTATPKATATPKPVATPKATPVPTPTPTPVSPQTFTSEGPDDDNGWNACNVHLDSIGYGTCQEYDGYSQYTPD